MSKKIEERDATIKLFIEENMILRKNFDDLRKRANAQAAEILVFIDKTKQERLDIESHVLKLERELNEFWGFVQAIKDMMGDDSVVKSLLERYSLDDENSCAGYIN